MKINGVEFDLDKAAYDIGYIAAKRTLTVPTPLTSGEITDLLQGYVNAVVQIKSMSQEEIKTLIR